MKRITRTAVQVIFRIFMFYLLYFIGIFLVDNLFGTAFSFKRALISATVFALLWAFVIGYKTAKEIFFNNCSAQKRSDKTPRN